MYLNSEPISLVLRVMDLPRKDAIYMVPRPLQKLGGDSSLVPTDQRGSPSMIPNFSGDLIDGLNLLGSMMD